ncbi:MAG: hypothetical protein JW832_10055 [Deltaproteobacteria bacterium]|nr:hypothetical protein [Deltaproteobacteria bacterium]
MYRYRALTIFFYLTLIFLLCGASRAGGVDSSSSLPPQAPIKNLSELFNDHFFYQPSPPATFTTALPEGRVTVETTLREDLQKRLMNLFARSGPMIAAAVAIDAKTGAVLAMGNKTAKNGASLLPDGADNYCVYGGFPAASLAKIITAAVALEKKGFTTDHLVPVAGRYHTLYRSQVGIERSPYKPEMVPLDKAFGLSINPYFGKMWLDSFADREFLDMGQGLLFNMPLEFDLPVTKSRLVPPADDFQRAEVASGYNTRTTISPLHAALIAALPANGGKLMRPYIINRVTDADGRLLYANSARQLGQPLSVRSAAQLNELMRETVQNGTARNSFTYVKRIAAAKGWTLGGKTGSIDLPGHTGRCDWFAGFGQAGSNSVAVACILVHGTQRTMRSSFVGAELIRGSLDPAGAAAPPQVQAKKKPAPRTTKSLAKANTKVSTKKKTKVKTPVKQAAKPASKKRPASTQHTGG